MGVRKEKEARHPQLSEQTNKKITKDLHQTYVGRLFWTDVNVFAAQTARPELPPSI
jgi:hypothetical protein